MRKKFHTFLLSLILLPVLLTNTIFASQPPEPTELYAKAAVLMDADTGRVLYEKNGYEILPNASTTKIMTCIVALEEGNPDMICEASANAASQPKVRIGVRAGEKFRLKDLLYSLMLESHNDAAVMIAEAVGGSVEGFAEMMNQKAWDLGCENTYFITPNGLDAADERGIHSTTAADLAKIMAYCLQNEEFLRITQTSSYQFTDLEGSHSVSCVNHNAFLQMMDGALSGKTGFTGNAGYCYVGALRRDGKTFVVALLACGWPNNKSYKWSDTRKLMNYGLENYSRKDVWQEVELPELPVQNGVPESQDLSCEAKVSLALDTERQDLSLLLRADEEVTESLEIWDELTAPVEEGSIVGQLNYRLNGENIYSCPVQTSEAVEAVDFFWCLKQVIRLTILL